MIYRPGILKLLVGLVLMIGASLASANSPSAEQWRAIEITLTSSKPYAHPFYDVDVTATFTGPGGSLVRPAFWDGQNTWRVRFAPTAPGTWTYTTSCSDPSNAGLHQQRGSVACVPYRGNLDIYRRGFLRVSDDHRRLAYRDGTPFFWLADTHWLFEIERLEESNKPGWASQFKGMADARVAQGFTVYQVELFGRWQRAPIGGAIASASEPAIEHFQKNVDPKFAYLADKGLVIATTLGILPKDVTAEQGQREARMARYVAARYGAYPMSWLTYQECTANIWPTRGRGAGNRDVFMQAVRGVGLAYQQADAYGHPRTAHSDAPLVTAYRGESWLDFTMFQGGHGKVIDRSPYYDFYFDAAHTLPQIEGEANYERLFEGSTEVKPDRILSDDDAREKAYQAMQCGCSGYTYAANGVWQANWDASLPKDGKSVYGTTPWYDGIDLPGGRHMSIFKAFYVANDWPSLLPRPQCDGFIRPSAPADAPDQAIVAADAAVSRVIVYFLRGKPPQGMLLHLQDAPYSAEWYDPRTGATSAIGTCVPKNAAWNFPAKPNERDWLLVLKAQNPSSAAPQLPSRWNELKAARLAEQAKNAAPRAQVSASSTDAAHDTYAPERAIDGNVDTSDWRHWSNDGRTNPASATRPPWLMLKWPQPLHIRRIVLYTMKGHELADYAIEYHHDGTWRVFPGAEVTGNTQPVREHVASTPITADAVRVLARKGPAKQPTIARIVELEIFEE